MLAVKVILLAIAAVCVVQGDLTQEDRDFLEEVFKNVPVKDRKEFLIQQLHRGYILKHPSQEYPVNKTVTLKLYEIYTGKSMETTRNKLLAMICFDDGSCVDTDEPAAYP